MDLADHKKMVAEYALSLGTDLSQAAFKVAEGHDRAPVMLVGYQLGPDETAPFTSESRHKLRSVLRQMRVGPGLLYLTNLIKIPSPVIVDQARCSSKWVDLLFQEIDAVEARAVILLGMPVAGKVLKFGDDALLDEFRRTRFQWPGRSKANFFVTYGPEDVEMDDGVADIHGLNWLADLKAVFEVDAVHYDSVETVKD